MVKRISAKAFFVCVVLALLGLAGCATPQTRSQERAEAFGRLSKEQQKNALAGKVTAGMNHDAVYVALGKPSRVLKSLEKNVERERWIYTEIDNEELPAWQSVYRQEGNGVIVSHAEYNPIRIQYRREAFEVVFEKGKVTAWREL